MTATQWISAFGAFAVAIAICGLTAALAVRGVVWAWRLCKIVFGPRSATQWTYASTVSSFAPSEQGSSVAILEAVNSLTALVTLQGRQIDEMHAAFQIAQAQRARSS
jgi:hypothetical protein